MSVLHMIAPPSAEASADDGLPARTVRMLVLRRDPAIGPELRRLIAAEPNLTAVAAPGVAPEALVRARDLEPHVVLIDRDRPAPDDLSLAGDLKALPRPPGVLLHSGSGDPEIVVAAIVAGVDGIISTRDRADVIGDAIRWIAQGGRWMPEVPLPALSRMGSRVEREDVPILAMLVRGMPSAEIARALAITAASLDSRRRGMLRRMGHESTRDAITEIGLDRGHARKMAEVPAALAA